MNLHLAPRIRKKPNVGFAEWNANALPSTSPSSPTVTPVLSGVSLEDYSLFVVSSTSHSRNLAFLWGGCHFWSLRPDFSRFC